MTTKFTLVAGFAAAFMMTAPASAGNNIAKKAVGGAVVGAAIAEATGGDAAEGAAVGAAVGALVGAKEKNDAEDRVEDRVNRKKEEKKEIVLNSSPLRMGLKQPSAQWSQNGFSQLY